MEIKFSINEQSINSMTWEEFEMFEKAQEGTFKLYQLRPILARFMMNGDSSFMEHDKAMKILAKIPVGKIKETVELFMSTLKDGAVPKANGNSLNSPSDQVMEGSEFPSG
jgi:hypothetical protein